MANLLYLCGRDGAIDSYSDAELRLVARRITPDNAPGEVRIVRDGGTVICLVGDATPVPVEGTSVCMGRFVDRPDDWAAPGTGAPDGTYALVRNDDETVELLSDIVGSRSLFYRQFDDLFVASTSQRAVMHFADSFQFDRRTIPWMLASGTLGYRQTWDDRVSVVPPDGRVRLDRSDWAISRTAPTPSFDPETYDDYEERFVDALADSCAGLDIDTEDWAIPLSGGLDSRALLLEYMDADGIEAVTWGTSEALTDDTSDAAIARELAAATDVSHTYYELPTSPDDVETVFERFLTAGEGCIDHVGGYIDGFDTFASMAGDGVRGIIRGDVALSQTVVKTPEHGRVNVGVRMLDDYAQLPSLDIPAGDQQEWPDRFRPRSSESISTWRDRVYQMYRIPHVLAPLSALKQPYVEIVNPLLTRRSVETIRRMPDEARTGKEQFRDHVFEKGPDIPIAETGATPEYADIFGAPATVDYLRSEIDTRRARQLFGTELVEWTLDQMGDRTDAGSGSAPSAAEWSSATDEIKYAAANVLPASVTKRIAAYAPVEAPKISIDPNHLAFRLFIVLSMVDRIERDVETLDTRSFSPIKR